MYKEMLDLTKITHLEGIASKLWLNLIRKYNIYDQTAKSNNIQEHVRYQY